MGTPLVSPAPERDRGPLLAFVILLGRPGLLLVVEGVDPAQRNNNWACSDDLGQN